MGLKSRRRNVKHGDSIHISLPASLEKGEESTLAANRIMIVDPRGEIPEEALLEFLEGHVEPEFWKWWKEKQESLRLAEPEPSTSEE